MTKQSKSGAVMPTKESEMDIDKDQWYGQEVSANSDPLVDSGTGTPIIMRFFEFEANPEMFKHKPTNQELFNAHSQQIRMMLWGDGLEPFQGIEPKIIRSKNKPSYRIMITCIPKKGVAVTDTSQTLQQIINPHGK